MMRSEIQLQRGESLREDNPLQLYKIVSLWDIMRFYAEQWLGIFRLIGQIEGMVEIADELQSLPRKTIPPDNSQSLDALDQELQRLPSQLSKMELFIAAESAKELAKFMKRYIEQGEIFKARNLASEFSRITEYEFRNKIVIMIPGNRARLYRVEASFLGEEVLTRTSELTEDAEEAGNCFAFGRYTACVFHLMRIMETIVQEVAIKMEIKNENGSILDVRNEKWSRIEQGINKRICSMERGERRDKYGALRLLLPELERVGAIQLCIRKELTLKRKPSSFLHVLSFS